MARAVNVILQIAGTNKSFNINDMGLVEMTFNRFPVVDSDSTRSFMPEIQIQVMDKTGMDMLRLLQENSGNLLMRYGFDDQLSETFKLTAVRLRMTLSDLGAMINIQAVGSQVVQTHEGEIYTEGTKVIDILRAMASRNGWYIGDTEDTSYINVGNIVLNRTLVKKAGEADFDFINSKLLPVIKSSVLISPTIESINYWELRLVHTNSRVEFYCRPYSARSTTRRLWAYEHGSVKPDSQVISFTNDIDMTFLINGLNITIPATAVDSTVAYDSGLYKETIEQIAASRISDIENLIVKYNLPLPDLSNFKLNVEIVEAENTGNKEVADYLLEAIENSVRVLNSAKMVILGNPRIMPTDLIEFRSKARDGSNTIISSTGFSYWRIVGIEEKIGIGGYITTLDLVRESIGITTRDYEGMPYQGPATASPVTIIPSGGKVITYIASQGD